MGEVWREREREREARKGKERWRKSSSNHPSFPNFDVVIFN